LGDLDTENELFSIGDIFIVGGSAPTWLGGILPPFSRYVIDGLAPPKFKLPNANKIKNRQADAIAEIKRFFIKVTI
jgi:hypothetical protein